MTQTVEEALKEFHEVYELDKADKPIPEITAGLWELRNNLHVEEFRELQEAMDQLYDAETPEEFDAAMVLFADAACDLTYVVVGSCVSFGIPFDKCFAEVQRSNMSKLGEDGKPIVRKEDGKILKGPFFSQPNLHKIIYGTKQPE